LNSKILSLLGFATKAGKLSFGYEACVSTLKANKAKLVVVAEDISEKSFKEITFFALKADVKYIRTEGISIKALSDAVGRKCGIIAVNDKGFADALLKANLG
jgi:ribosomal protein L7Ae-like RNA K-turn-binding protein